MADFVALDSDILVFTDKEFTAGGIVSEAQPAEAQMVTRGTLLVLREAFFPEGEIEDVDTLGAKSLAGVDKAEDRKFLAEMFEGLPGLKLSGREPKLGDVSRAASDGGKIELGQSAAYAPPGTHFRRRVGSKTITFAVDDRSIADLVRPRDRLGAVGVIGGDLTRLAASSSCGACGACGVCGGCILCAEINYAAGAAAATAAVSATALSAATMRPDISAPRAVDRFGFGRPGGVRPDPVPFDRVSNGLGIDVGNLLEIANGLPES